MIFLRIHIATLLLIFAGTSCQMMRHEVMTAAEVEQRSTALTEALLAMPGVDEASTAVQAEARELAWISVAGGEAFAQANRAVRPAWWNNCLVNLKIHRWGLCWHYQHYLFAHLHETEPRYFTLYFGARDKGRLFHEHNCVVIGPRDGEFHDGLVIDPWEQSGRTIWFKTRGESGEWINEPHLAKPLIEHLEDAESKPRSSGSEAF